MALNQTMDAFTSYLSTVVWNTMGPAVSVQDVEEVVSDVFLALWFHRDKIDPEQGLETGLLTVCAPHRRPLCPWKMRAQ